ncbi:MAG: flagellar hook-basal body complex protein FliE [Syntrophomonadaceae bacterium]|nr:flagellar hook-basal body complex protein FliE [Syntrophomonadaceae bacterium]MDD3023432.1 flagellar hook-basal body complex protein FliE [Syntrophomonadaceae bacterium]
MKLGATDIRHMAGASGLVQNDAQKNAAESQKIEAGFLGYLKDALQDVNDLQVEAAANAEKLALGDQTYLHNTMLAYEKANLALQLTVEVRNKIVEAYQDLMRIQM